MPSTMITGGAGFIGSNFVRLMLQKTTDKILVLDKLTYAGCLESLADVEDHERFSFVQGDICDEALVRRLLDEHQVQRVVNFAAESDGVTQDDIIDRLLAVTPTKEDELTTDARFQKIFAS